MHLANGKIPKWLTTTRYNISMDGEEIFIIMKTVEQGKISKYVPFICVVLWDKCQKKMETK